MPNRSQGPNREDAPYRPYVAPKKQKKKETYDQLKLDIPLAKGKGKFKNDPSTSANVS